MDFDIETVSDVLTLLFKLDEQIDMNFETKKDKEGKIIPSSIKISFSDAEINSRLSKYIAAREIRQHMANERDSFENEADYNASLDALSADIEEIKNHLIDSNRIVCKDMNRLSVKN